VLNLYFFYDFNIFILKKLKNYLDIFLKNNFKNETHDNYVFFFFNNDSKEIVRFIMDSNSLEHHPYLC
jgi:hypothetical protein